MVDINLKDRNYRTTEQEKPFSLRCQKIGYLFKSRFISIHPSIVRRGPYQSNKTFKIVKVSRFLINRLLQFNYSGFRCC